MSSLHGLSSSRRADRFSYINHFNPRSYATWRGKTRSGCVFSRERLVLRLKGLSSDWKACHPSEKLAIRVKSCHPSESLSSEWKYSYPSEGLMTEWKVSIRVKLRSRSPGTWDPNEALVGESKWHEDRLEHLSGNPSEVCSGWNQVKNCLPSEIVPSEWNIAIRVKSIQVEYCHQSENIATRVEYCHPSEKLPAEWKATVRVTLRSRNRSDIKSG